ncbi:MAG: nucleotide-binding protein [Candidatus Cloacimonetes bacterium]|nr:nucleotide-binding protein [Candidatus Cloacimonadota bacterium]
MKPRIFIGSSVEGLSIAYSIQQNLLHDAEVTVWDQGVFELSSTTIESLLKILDSSDFGIFVFSNDDMKMIKNKRSETVRDNVLFEFGLFIGKLSRERVYFVIPSDTEMHLPSDLLGITPGTFNPNREDGSLQAATGPFCNQIRLMINKLGKTVKSNDVASTSEDKTIVETEKHWLKDFFAKRYVDARQKLEKIIEKDPENQLINKYWLLYCDFKINEYKNSNLLDDYLEKHNDDLEIYENVSRIYLNENYLVKSKIVIQNAFSKFGEIPILIILNSKYIEQKNGVDESIIFLQSHSRILDIDISLTLINKLMEKEDYLSARKFIHDIYIKFPNNEEIRYKYGRIAYGLKDNNISLFLLQSLTNEFDKSEYWGYLSNTALQLNYYDLALSACRKADSITVSKEGWIQSNIGNLFKNKGFYRESLKYFEQSIKIDNKSDYAHERMAFVLKKIKEEKEQINNSFEQGRMELAEYNVEESD